MITYAGGSTEYHYVPFDAEVSDEWQFVSMPIVPERADAAVETIRVELAYERNANAACFDNISLVREVVLRMAYDDNGNTTSSESTGENYVYDDNQNLTSVQTGGNGTFSYVYDDTYVHRLETSTNGVLTQNLTYDSAGNVLSTIVSSADTSNPLRIITSSTYSADGNRLLTVKDALGNQLTYGYASELNIAYGLPSSVTDPKGVMTAATYDVFGRTTGVSISGTASVNYTYGNNVLQQILRTNSSGGTQAYMFSYNDFEQLVGIKVGTRTLVTHTYADYNGDLLSTTYGNGITVSYTYDVLGRVIQETYSDGRTVTYHYNSEGQLAKTVDGSTVTYYTYDSIGRLIMTYDGYMGARVRFTYDADGRLTETARKATSRTGTYIWSDSSEAYTYSEGTAGISAGTLTGMQMLTGATLAFGYDYLQRLTTRNVASTLVETYTYEPGSIANTTGTLVNGKKNVLGGVTKNNFTYTYDENGNIETAYDAASGITITYTYDNQNQLLRAVHSDGRTETYTYDSVGNILTFNNGSISKSLTYGDSQWKDLLTKVNGVSLVYDAGGNPTSYYNGSSYTLEWHEGRKLESSTKNGSMTTYTYNVDGLRRTKLRSDGSGVYYIIMEGKIVGEEHVDAEDETTGFMRYTFDESGSVCGYSYSVNGTDWTDFYFIKNLQGDVLQVFRAGDNAIVASYTYDSWGNILSETGLMADMNPFRYRGYYYDAETGWYWLSSRYYDPEVGRFINADDVSYLGADGSLLSYNLFAYCNNNPINMIDADGHAAIHIALATIFGIAGWAFGDFVAKQLGYSSGWKYWAIRSGVAIGGAILGGVCASLLTKAVAVYLQSHSSVLIPLVKKWGVSKFCSVMKFLGVNPFLVSMDNSKFIALVRLFNDKAITLTYQWAVSLYNKAISLGYQIMFDEPHGGYQWHIHFIGSKGKLGNLHVQIPKTAWDYLSKLLD